jgi:hypothetical protein
VKFIVAQKIPMIHLKKYIFLLIAILTVTATPALAITIDPDNSLNYNFNAIPCNSGYTITLELNESSPALYKGGTKIAQIGWNYAGYQYDLCNFDPTIFVSNGIGTYQIGELSFSTYYETDIIYATNIVDLYWLTAPIIRIPFSSGFSAGGVAEISEYIFTDLIPLASVAIGVFLGISLLTYAGHLFKARKRR